MLYKYLRKLGKKHQAFTVFLNAAGLFPNYKIREYRHTGN